VAAPRNASPCPSREATLRARWARRAGACALLALTLASIAGCADPTATAIPPDPVTEVAPSLVPLPPSATPLPPTITPTPSTTPVVPLPEPYQTPNNSGRVHLAAVGDIMLGRSTGERILSQGAEVPFAGVADVLRAADLAVGNLECAMGSGGTAVQKYYTFLAPPEGALALHAGGLDIINLANNHSLDYGLQTLAETLGLLRGNGMYAVGAGMSEAQAYGPRIVDVNGLRIAFLGRVNIPVELTTFDTRSWAAVGDHAGIAWGEAAEMKEAVRAAKAQADVVVVLLHAGWEMYYAPPSEERVLAQAAIDGGASLVLGTHSHLIQATDATKPGTLIAYGLGNFVFDEFDGGATDSAILHVELTRAGVESFAWQPVEIQSGFPVLVTLTPSP
jgi:poly-gamma-glutamate capsule biosynthesis protein CapA/YwtB (metallophosphatase superfamily)